MSGTREAFHARFMHDNWVMSFLLPLVDASHHEAHHRKTDSSGDQEQVVETAQRRAQKYEEAGETIKEWDYYYLVAKSQIISGAYTAALRTIVSLMRCSIALGDPTVTARSLILRSAAQRHKLLFQQAIDSSQEALELLEANSENPRIHAEAYQGLMTCLVEVGRTAEAWALKGTLTRSLERIDDPEAASRGHWTLGNVALAQGEYEQGAAHHDLAAELLSSVNDLHEWARFNKEVADSRLLAGIADAHTLHCIDRSQVAYDVIGGSESELVGLAVTRARWTMATGNLLEASGILRAALKNMTLREDSKHVVVHQLWAEILTKLGHHEQARQQAEEAQRIQALPTRGSN